MTRTTALSRSLSPSSAASSSSSAALEDMVDHGLSETSTTTTFGTTTGTTENVTKTVVMEPGGGTTTAAASSSTIAGRTFSLSTSEEDEEMEVKALSIQKGTDPPDNEEAGEEKKEADDETGSSSIAADMECDENASSANLTSMSTRRSKTHRLHSSKKEASTSSSSSSSLSSPSIMSLSKKKTMKTKKKKKNKNSMELYHYRKSKTSSSSSSPGLFSRLRLGRRGGSSSSAKKSNKSKSNFDSSQMMMISSSVETTGDDNEPTVSTRGTSSNTGSLSSSSPPPPPLLPPTPSQPKLKMRPLSSSSTPLSPALASLSTRASPRTPSSSPSLRFNASSCSISFNASCHASSSSSSSCTSQKLMLFDHRDDDDRQHLLSSDDDNEEDDDDDDDDRMNRMMDLHSSSTFVIAPLLSPSTLSSSNNNNSNKNKNRNDNTHNNMKYLPIKRSFLSKTSPSSSSSSSSSTNSKSPYKKMFTSFSSSSSSATPFEAAAASSSNTHEEEEEDTINLLHSPKKENAQDEHTTQLTVLLEEEEEEEEEAPQTPIISYSDHRSSIVDQEEEEEMTPPQQQDNEQSLLSSSSSQFYLQTPPSKSPVPIVVSSKKLGNDIRVQHQKKNYVSRRRRRIVGCLDRMGGDKDDYDDNEGDDDDDEGSSMGRGGADVQMRMKEMDLSTNSSSSSPSTSVLFNMMDDDDDGDDDNHINTDQQQQQKQKHSKKKKNNNRKKKNDIPLVEILDLPNYNSTNGNNDDPFRSLLGDDQNHDMPSPASSLSSSGSSPENLRMKSAFGEDEDVDDEEDDYEDMEDDDDDDDYSSGSSTVIQLPTMPRPPPSATKDEQAKFYWELCYGSSSSSTATPMEKSKHVVSWSASRLPPTKSCLSSKKKARTCVASSAGNQLHQRSTPTLCDRFQFNDDNIMITTKTDNNNNNRAVKFHHPSPPTVENHDNSVNALHCEEMIVVNENQEEKNKGGNAENNTTMTNTAKVVASTPRARTTTTNIEKSHVVKFGSPSVAEFEEDNPTNQLTPLPSEYARERFPVEEVEEPEEEIEMHKETVQNAALLAEWEEDFDSFLDYEDEAEDSDIVGSDGEGREKEDSRFDLDVSENRGDGDDMDLGSPNISQRKKRRKKVREMVKNRRRISRGDRRSSSFFSKGGKSLLDDSSSPKFDDHFGVGGNEERQELNFNNEMILDDHVANPSSPHKYGSSDSSEFMPKTKLTHIDTDSMGGSSLSSSPRSSLNTTTSTTYISPSFPGNSANSNSSVPECSRSSREDSTDLLRSVQSSGGALSCSSSITSHSDREDKTKVGRNDPLGEDELRPSNLDAYLEKHSRSRTSQNDSLVQSDGTWEEIAQRQKLQDVDCFISTPPRSPLKVLVNGDRDSSKENERIPATVNIYNSKIFEEMELSCKSNCSIMTDAAAEFDSALKLSPSPLPHGNIGRYYDFLRTELSKSLNDTLLNANCVGHAENHILDEKLNANDPLRNAELSRSEIYRHFGQIALLEWKRFESQRLYSLLKKTSCLSDECKRSLSTCETMLQQADNLMDTEPLYKENEVGTQTGSVLFGDKNFLSIASRQRRKSKKDKKELLNLQTSKILSDISSLENLLDSESKKLQLSRNTHRRLSSQYYIEGSTSTSSLLCLSLCSVLPFYLVDESNGTAEVAHAHADGTSVTQIVFHPNGSISLSGHACSISGREINMSELSSVNDRIDLGKCVTTSSTNEPPSFPTFPTTSQAGHSSASFQEDSVAAQFLSAFLYGHNKNGVSCFEPLRHAHLCDRIMPQLEATIDDSSALLLASEILCRVDVASMDIFELECKSECSVLIKFTTEKVVLMVDLDMGRTNPSVKVEFSYDRENQHTLKYAFPEKMTLFAVNDTMSTLPIETLQAKAENVLMSQRPCNVGLLCKTCSILVDNLRACYSR